MTNPMPLNCPGEHTFEGHARVFASGWTEKGAIENGETETRQPALDALEKRFRAENGVHCAEPCRTVIGAEIVTYSPRILGRSWRYLWLRTRVEIDALATRACKCVPPNA